ncbi:MAG: heme exporter protein CcmB [Clostridia bacterium]|nr:heme exporter protein CcmB [Deltaproteobacteria bacterium]
MTLLRTIATLVVKDLRLEWRSRARVNSTLFFALLTLFLFSFASGPVHAILAANAPGYLWLALLLASVLALGESMRIEVENDMLEALRLSPVDARALFLAKALVNAAFLTLLGVVLVPVVIALYGAELILGLPRLVGTLGLGALAVSAPGTLYATIAAQARARDVLLPLLLFPVIVPGLLASVRATALIMQGDPMNQIGSWTTLLVIFDGLYWLLCTVLYPRVIEE